MPGPIAAIAGSAIVGAGTSFLSSRSASQAADKAAKEQRKAVEASIKAQERALERQIALQKPFYESSVNALRDYQTASAPSYTPFGMDQFNADPGYQFRMAEGLKALERSASARGILQSGQTLKDITRFGQDVASQEYQNAFNRYMTEAEYMRRQRLDPLEYQIGLGQAAAANQAANIGTTAGATSELLQARGNIGAQRAVAQGNITSGLYNSLGDIAGGAVRGFADYQANLPYQNYLSALNAPRNPTMIGGAY